MTSFPPDDADAANRETPTPRERSAAEVDAEFAAIVSGISGQMSWGTTGRQLDTAATSGGAAPAPSTNADDHDADADHDGPAAARERERRRALRRAQRAEEVASYTAGQAEAAAELQADDAHFIPPEPPPLPRPKRRTVVALLFMVIGIVMLVRPSLLQVAPNVVLVLGIFAVVGGFGMLVHGLRPHAPDPDDTDGWDDGARL